MRKWKCKRFVQWRNGLKKNAAASANTGKAAALQVAVEEIVSYCLLGDSPVTMGKVVRWLQSSQDPSYIFAS